ncbi:MAG: FecR domain-containing protein [Tannerellaceae bacterium]|jgi:ferric-dicitrate binding protein FerR (iron transport regulator)|nr:FecR domain-containing protein [Tannerellaceae bacterium]
MDQHNINTEQEWGEQIVRYFHNDLGNEEMEALNRWLQESPDNKTFFFQLKEIHDCLTMPQNTFDAEATEKSWQSIQAKLNLPQPDKRRISVRFLKYIAVAAVAIVAGIIIGWYFNTDDSATATSYNEIHVRKGSRPNSITLSDGTCIKLNAGSSLKYPSSFSGSQREVSVEGEAWFEVAHDERAPFVVHLPRQTVTVHGTSFNVEAYPGEDANIVTLASGCISLESCGANGHIAGRITLWPGHRAHFNRSTGSVYVEDADPEAAGLWIRGEYKFKDEPLEQIIKRLENHYGLDIRMADCLKQTRYTGAFAFSQSIGQILRIINHENRFRFHQEVDTIYINLK